MKYEIGDRVREIATGDEGIIIYEYIPSWNTDVKHWMIKWKTGSCTSCDLSLPETGMELVTENNLDGKTLTIDGVTYRLQKI